MGHGPERFTTMAVASSMDRLQFATHKFPEVTPTERQAFSSGVRLSCEL
jgi:hypothetical protein